MFISLSFLFFLLSRFHFLPTYKMWEIYIINWVSDTCPYRNNPNQDKKLNWVTHMLLSFVSFLIQGFSKDIRKTTTLKFSRFIIQPNSFNLAKIIITDAKFVLYQLCQCKKRQKKKKKKLVKSNGYLLISICLFGIRCLFFFQLTIKLFSRLSGNAVMGRKQPNLVFC